MMRTLHKEKGATLRIEILTEPSVQNFITTHADTLDNAFKTVPMSDAMRRRLQRSDYIFSGIKTFHEINEAFPSLLNTDGTRKPFTQFLEEVKHIDKTYNQHYLAAEFNFAQASAAMAAKWEQYAQDGDRYLLQYRTAGDDRVRPEHASLEGVTLPITDTFWQEFYPPNGWNCRCTVTQVLKSQATPTPHEQAIALGEDALKLDKHRFFRHNSGITGKTFPDYNPYTIQRCRDCDIAKGKLKLAKPSNEVCEACKTVYSSSKEKEKQCLIKKKEEIRENTPDATYYSKKLSSGVYEVTKKRLSRGIWHARDFEETIMFVEITKHLDELKYIRFSPLGEVKNMNDPKDVKNVNNKKKIHVIGYHIYELQLGTVTWIVKTEEKKNHGESAYNIQRK